MPIKLELPIWMTERIVAILEEHPYTGSQDIIQEIKEQIDNCAEE